MAWAEQQHVFEAAQGPVSERPRHLAGSSANDNESGRTTPAVPWTRSALPADAVAVIERPARSVTQSGRAREKAWRLRFDSRSRPFHDPLTGWIGGQDPLAQIEFTFPTREAAVRYAQSQGLRFEVRNPASQHRRIDAKQAFQATGPLSICCWPTGPHPRCCGEYPALKWREDHVS